MPETQDPDLAHDMVEAVLQVILADTPAHVPNTAGAAAVTFGTFIPSSRP